MMTLLTKKAGFTLLEIIVVMIIVGVLAAVALPNLFINIERQRAQEAMTTLGLIDHAIETCIQSNLGDPSNCSFISSIDVSLPQNARFSYSMSIPGGAIASSGVDTISYFITACRNLSENGATCINAATTAQSSLWLLRASGGFYAKGANAPFIGVW